MKFKAAITENAPEKLIESLNSASIGSRLMDRVVKTCLHVPEMELGPATHYVQKTDKLIALSDDIGVVVGLTLVSRTRTRSEEDFADALRAIEEVYEEAIEAALPAGSKAQLFVAIALDGDIEAPSHMGFKHTNLIETVPKWIEARGD